VLKALKVTPQEFFSEGFDEEKTTDENK